MAAGKIDYQEFIDIVASSAPSVGHCNTMGTASTMNALAEALGMSLPGCAAIPAPYRERGADRLRDRRARGRDRARGSEALRHPHAQGVRERHRRQLGDRRLDQRADPHQRHRAPHRRASSTIEDWEKIGYDVPLLVNMQPAGKYLGEEYYRAGGLPAVMNELLQGRAHPRRRADHQRQDHGRERRGARRSATPTSSGPTTSR